MVSPHSSTPDCECCFSFSKERVGVAGLFVISESGRVCGEAATAGVGVDVAGVVAVDWVVCAGVVLDSDLTSPKLSSSKSGGNIDGGGGTEGGIAEMRRPVGPTISCCSRLTLKPSCDPTAEFRWPDAVAVVDEEAEEAAEATEDGEEAGTEVDDCVGAVEVVPCSCVVDCEFACAGVTVTENTGKGELGVAGEESEVDGLEGLVGKGEGAVCVAG